MFSKKQRLHSLSNVIQEKLIHADRTELSEEEKKVLRKQAHGGMWFLSLSILFLVMIVMFMVLKWNKGELSTGLIYAMIITYLVIEIGVTFVSFRNARHLLPWCRNYRTKGYVVRVYNTQASEKYFEIAYYNVKKRVIISQSKSIMDVDILLQFNYKNVIPQQIPQYQSLSPEELIKSRDTARRMQHDIGIFLEREGRYPKKGELIDIIIREKGRRSVIAIIPLDQHFGEDEK